MPIMIALTVLVLGAFVASLVVVNRKRGPLTKKVARTSSVLAVAALLAVPGVRLLWSLVQQGKRLDDALEDMLASALLLMAIFTVTLFASAAGLRGKDKRAG